MLPMIFCLNHDACDDRDTRMKPSQTSGESYASQFGQGRSDTEKFTVGKPYGKEADCEVDRGLIQQVLGAVLVNLFGCWC